MFSKRAGHGRGHQNADHLFVGTLLEHFTPEQQCANQRLAKIHPASG